MNPDRPLTVPLRVRGVLDYSPSLFLFLLLTLVGIGALLAALTGTPLLECAASVLVLPILFLVPALGLAFLLLFQESRLVVTMSGFVVQGAGGERVVRDEEVVGFGHGRETGKRVRYRAVVGCKREGTTEWLRFTYDAESNSSDPLRPLWDRVVASLTVRVRAGLAEGRSLAGEDWELTAAELRMTREGTQTDWADLTGGLSGGYLDIYRQGDTTPWQRLPLSGLNVRVLAALLLLSQGNVPEDLSGDERIRGGESPLRRGLPGGEED